MRKYLLLATLLLQTTFLSAQNLSKSTGNVKQSPENVSYLSCDESRAEVRKSLSYYTEWRGVSCYSRMKYRIAAFSLGIIRGSQKNVWKIQFKNNYAKNVNIKFQLYVDNELRIYDIISVNAGKYWGIECAGGSDAELSESLSLDYKLEIEYVKEDVRGMATEKVEELKCDGNTTIPNYKSYHPSNSSGISGQTSGSNQAINQLTTATVDLVKYFANRKNALRNSLSKEDGQALMDIVNSENPTDYTQNLIQIFEDLGYTLRETERKDNYVIITLNNDIANINDFMMIFIRPASYDYYNSISFSYHRKQKLREQLAILGDNLKGSNGLELQGISPSNAQKKADQDQKNLNQKTKSAKMYIEAFSKYDYWNKTDRQVFSYAKDIAEAYEDENALNNKSEAIRYYRKAASITLDSLTSPWKGDKSMRAYQQEELAKIYFKLAYLLDDDKENNGEEAITWYLKSSEVDYSKSSSNLNIARIYKGGLQGVEKDWNAAKNYYEVAADNKNAKAMYNLGKLYETGGPNLEKDESKSKKWFKKACKEDKKYCN